MKNEIKDIGWNLDNSYLNLSNVFYSKVNLNHLPSPKLIILNEPLAKQLGLNSTYLKSEEGVKVLSGTKTIENGAFIAQAYAGHQFGHFTMLGDGRALLIGEQVTPLGERYDIQLKGSGKTPYSRRGDGKAVLGPMIREYIISEAMHHLNIPTTRSLSVVKTGETVIRETLKEGAILTRVASSHIRFGTFEYISRFGTKEQLKELADYSIKRHYKDIKDDNNKYINFLKEVIKSQSTLVSKWQSVGFIHGVMNTDNMTISGETIDYGPCAFMDTYKEDTVFSSIDTYGRYSYKNQPKMLGWNLCRFAESLLPLLSENKEESINMAQEAISDYFEIYYNNWISIMRSKIGIFNEEELDKFLIEELLSIMEKHGEDYTNTFVSLTLKTNMDKDMFISEEFKSWYNKWQERLKRQSNSVEEVTNLMKKSNPYVIPRNHRVEEAIKAANNGDLSVMVKLLDILSRPYDYSKDQEDYTKLPEYSTCNYNTYCGT